MDRRVCRDREAGDAVGVMAWNTPRHLEVWYGVPGAGAALHTLNPRLSPDQLVYIVNHAEDRLLLVDADLAPVIARIRDRLESVGPIVVLTDAAHMPDLPGAIPYEDWIAVDGDFAWVDGDEREIYENGERVRIETDTQGDHRPDVVMQMKGDEVVRQDEDTDFDGVIDQRFDGETPVPVEGKPAAPAALPKLECGRFHSFWSRR